MWYMLLELGNFAEQREKIFKEPEEREGTTHCKAKVLCKGG